MKFPTGTVTFLFTDIEGSTELAQAYAKTWEDLRSQHNHILRSAIESNNGYVFRIIGDAFCAAFDTAGDALRAALRAQTDLQVKPWDGPPIHVRMGIHTGRADLQEDGEYLGYLTLTRVQRVMSAAYGGQVLLSNAAAELARGDLPEEVSLLDMHEHRLKGLQKPEQLWQAISPGLPQDFPPLKTLHAIPNNLPVQLTSFIGRQKELDELIQALQTHRLITLTGPGGVGKTRLSIEVGSEVVHGFPQGVWFVELEHVKDPDLIPAAVAHTFSLQEMPGQRILDTLKDYLRDKELLLILDNFEQVIEAAGFVKELLLAALRIKILVSSRTALRVAGEYEYRVPLLPLPDPEKRQSLDELADLESVRLFVDRAQSARADFRLTGENAPAIAETCQRLDGLPLAIELAAARVRVVPPQKMLGQLENRLKFLTSAARDLPARQQTLRAAITWSYDLLTPPEKLLFQRLAVFIGGATLEAIERICGGGDLDVLTHLESLLDKSLLRLRERGEDTRYEMLETIRDFADEMLVASGQADQLQSRHLAYFHRLAHLAEPHLVGPDELKWIVRFTEELDNLRAAILWGLNNDFEKGVELLCDLSLFWSRGGHNEQAIGWIQMALRQPALAEGDSTPIPRARLRARVLLTLGILSLQQGYAEAPSTLAQSITLLRQLDDQKDLAGALAFMGYLGDLEAAQESVDLARDTGDKWILAYSLVWQSQAIRMAGGDLELARRAAAEGAQLSREIGSIWAVARAVFSQGQLAMALGNLTEARAHLNECVTLFTQSQDKYHANLARTELAHMERIQRNYAEALESYKTSLQIWQDLGIQSRVAEQLEGIAMALAGQGNLPDAARFWGTAMRLREQTKYPLTNEEQREHEAFLAALHGEWEAARVEALLQEGRAMQTPEAIAKALALPVDR